MREDFGLKIFILIALAIIVVAVAIGIIYGVEGEIVPQVANPTNPTNPLYWILF